MEGLRDYALYKSTIDLDINKPSFKNIKINVYLSANNYST